MSEPDSTNTDRLAEAKQRLTSDSPPPLERKLAVIAGSVISVMVLLSALIWMIPSGPPEPARVAVAAPMVEDVWLLHPPAEVDPNPPAARLARLTIEPALMEPAAAWVEPSAPVAPLREPLLAIVIDDVGLELAPAERAIALPAQVTLAIMPHAPNAAGMDEAARAAGHETLVHLPMEPKGLDDPGINALYTWLPEEQLRERVRNAFAAAPGAIGFNNHMGSRFTACGRCVDVVAREAHAAGMIVLDSLTTPDSLLAEAARAAGAPTLSRDVFLDHQRDPDAIAVRLDEAERIAWSRGWAVAIGHPGEETLSVLEDWIPQAEARGLQLGGVSAVLERIESYAVAEGPTSQAR